LRVEEQILILGGDGGRERGAVAHKGAIVLESAGKMTFARGFDGAREIIESRMINLEGDWVRLLTSRGDLRWKSEWATS